MPTLDPASLPLKVAALCIALLIVGPPASAMPPGGAQDLEVIQVEEELTSLQRWLASIEAKAMELPEIQQKKAALEQKVDAALLAADPQFQAKMDRLDALRVQFDEAKAAGDEERVAALLKDARALDDELTRTQVSALAEPSLAAEVTAFREAVRDRMIEIDPEVEPRTARVEKLVARLRSSHGPPR